MAIDLQNPQNIETGWRGPTQFQAPAGIAAILENRRLQQEWQQKQIADAIKQYQSQREGQMYGQAARDAGLLPGVGDISNLTAAQVSDLAQRIGENTPDTDEDTQHKAAAARDYAIANAIKGGTYPYRGSGGARGANQVPLPDGQGGIAKDANGDDIYVNPNSVLYRQAMGAQDAAFRTPMSPTQAKAYLANVGISGVDALNSAQHTGFQQQPDGTLAPLTPDQSYDEDATHVKITPSAGGNPVTVPKAVLENVKKALMPGSYTDDTAPNQAPPSDVPPGGGTFPPNFSGFPPSAQPSPTATPGGNVTVGPVTADPSATPSTGRVRPNAATGAPVNLPNYPAPRLEDVKTLRGAPSPQNIKYFEQYYGPGSADLVLHPQ